MNQSFPCSIPQHLEWLELECDRFHTHHAQLSDSLTEAEDQRHALQQFMEAIKVGNKTTGTVTMG